MSWWLSDAVFVTHCKRGLLLEVYSLSFLSLGRTRTFCFCEFKRENDNYSDSKRDHVATFFPINHNLGRYSSLVGQGKGCFSSLPPLPGEKQISRSWEDMLQNLFLRAAKPIRHRTVRVVVVFIVVVWWRGLLWGQDHKGHIWPRQPEFYLGWDQGLLWPWPDFSLEWYPWLVFQISVHSLLTKKISV